MRLPGRSDVRAGSRRIMPIAELSIPGEHNVSNALAAIAAALLFGVPVDAIRTAAAAFTGVENRLEPVGTVDGVRFINDSQGTQPDAVIAALRSFPRPLVLIAGGRDKGVDLSGLGPVAAERADAAVLIGESGRVVGRAVPGQWRRPGGAGADTRGRGRTRRRHRQAAARRHDRSPAPATVLLSPAAASFDMFVDYAARGQAFRAAVAALAGRRGSGGSA